MVDLLNEKWRGSKPTICEPLLDVFHARIKSYSLGEKKRKEKKNVSPKYKHKFKREARVKKKKNSRLTSAHAFGRTRRPILPASLALNTFSNNGTTVDFKL